MTKYIWPSKFMPFGFRLFFFLLLVLFFVVSGYFKYVVPNSQSTSVFIVPYLLWLIWGYLFDRTMPLPPASPEFEEDDISMQLLRSIIAVISLIVMVLTIFHF